ncbi:MAG: NAD-dependent epimerase/dehydratase family protein [Nitrospinota bacterium]
MSFNILVTGGAGYLGSTLVPELLNAGHKVTVLDNFMFRQSSLNHVCHMHNFQAINGDVRNESVIKKAVQGMDIIIPLAALVGAPLCSRDPEGASTTNYHSIAKMLKLLSKEQRVIYPTTNSGYGIGEKGIYCTEETALRPISQYGKDKVAAEKAILERDNGLTFRLATVFGMSPRMRIDLLVNDFTYRAVNDRFIVLFESHFKRNYIHVRDVARAFMHAIDNFESMKNEPYNVGLSEANLSKLELCQEIEKHVPEFHFLEAEIGEDLDKRDYIVSNEKIEATGWKPKHSLGDGIKELVKGYTMIKNTLYTNV